MDTFLIILLGGILIPLLVFFGAFIVLSVVYDNSIIQYLNKPLYYLSQSLLRMSACDVVYFCKGWENARGCKIEHEVAKAYGLEIIYEE